MNFLKEINVCVERDCGQSFNSVKQIIAWHVVLTYFHPNKPIKLVCDASDKGILAVLSHIFQMLKNVC